MSVETPRSVPQRIRYIYEKPEGTEPNYINGVQGGMSSRGELVCNFFFEYMEVPKEEIFPIKEGKLTFDKGQVILRGAVDKEEIVVKRIVKASVAIPAQQISSITNWMLDILKGSKITVEKGEQ
jgi:hypothetical protein